MILKHLHFLSSIVALAAAAGQDGFFTIPPPAVHNQKYGDNEVYTLGDVVNLQWFSNVSPYNVSLWQQNLSKESASQATSPLISQSSGNGQGNLPWVVALPAEFSIQASNVYFLGVSHGSDNVDFTSHYFNITQPSPSSMSSASTATKTSSPTQSASSSSTSTPSNSTAIGIGVGLGFGIPLLILLAAMVLILWSRAAKGGRREADGIPTTESTGYATGGYQELARQEKFSPEPEAVAQPVSMYPGVQHVYEVPGYVTSPVELAPTGLAELDTTPR